MTKNGLAHEIPDTPLVLSVMVAAMVIPVMPTMMHPVVSAAMVAVISVPVPAMPIPATPGSIPTVAVKLEPQFYPVSARFI